jgi:hypothetical protein
MKNLFIFAAIILAVILTSFTSAHISSRHNKFSKNHAFPFNGAHTESFNGTSIYNPCTGEMLEFYGEKHILYHGVFNDMKSTGKLHVNDKGVNAISATGKVYSITGVLNFSSTTKFSNGVLTMKQIQRERWTTQGSRNNFTVSYSYHVTIDANGNAKFYRGEYEEYCQ